LVLYEARWRLVLAGRNAGLTWLYTFPCLSVQDVLVKQGDHVPWLYALIIAVAGLHVAK
jgi:hypothetical protein